MRINQKLKVDIAKSLNVTIRRVDQRISQRRQELPMTREHAAYTIAHEVGIDLAKYLSSQNLAEAREAISDWVSFKGSMSNQRPTSGESPSRAVATRKTGTLRIAGVSESAIPGLSRKHIKEANEMADKVYPMLYLFENSIRSIIERVLSAKFGAGWWTSCVSKRLRDKVKARKDEERKNTWHGRRGASEIYYLDLNDLWSIINHQWRHFEMLFPNKAWIENLITNDMNVSRRQVAHMNPIATSDVRNVETAFRKWTQQLQGVASSIP